MVEKCRIVNVMHSDITEGTVKELKRAITASGSKIFELYSGGDWYALAICTKNATKKQAMSAYIKWTKEPA